MKKLLLLAVVAGLGYVVYRQVSANQAEQDLWTEATAAPDLR
jgi:hypothetical protein